jgi:hypothetical protein
MKTRPYLPQSLSSGVKFLEENFKPFHHFIERFDIFRSFITWSSIFGLYNNGT